MDEHGFELSVAERSKTKPLCWWCFTSSRALPHWGDTRYQTGHLAVFCERCNARRRGAPKQGYCGGVGSEECGGRLSVAVPETCSAEIAGWP